MKATRMTQRVEHEVKIHYQLKHPSILELYTFFEDKNYVYLVLELCHNGEMQRYLKTRQKANLDEDETRHYLKQVIDGMIYLHSYGILHRDLTLSNLLLTKEMNVKIADFGLATKLNIPDEKHFTMCGTPNFISPEIASRNAHGLEADVWSLGCMMYTFLTGKPPFDTDGVRNTLNRVVHSDYEMPNYISPEAQDLIASLLKKNPAERLPLSKVLEHPFMSKRTNSPLNSLSFKHGSFNESIDSGRGTLTTSQRSNQKFNNSSNLATLQSGQEQDFINDKITSSSTSSSSSLSSSSKLNMDSKNMYYNRFLKQQQCLTSTPPSPPVKLSSYSPTKESNRLISASTNSLPISRSNNHLNFYTNNLPSLQLNSNCISNNNLNNKYLSSENLHGFHMSTSSSSSISPSPSALYTQQLTQPQQQQQQPPPQQQEKNDKKSKKSKEVTCNPDQKIQDCVSPLKASSTLLRPTRQASKNAVLNIMDRNEVVLELIKVKKNQQFIMEVIRIEPDNDLITIYQPNNGKGCLMTNRPPPLPEDKESYMQFNYRNLPQNYWKKYDLASKFVKMVRSRTPKITLHTEEAKCILYDTSPDFEALFYTGTKFHINKEGSIKITNPDGTSLSLESNSRSTCLSPDMQDMFEKAHKWHKFCLEEELIREKRKEIYKDIISFPLTIGRRPQVPLKPLSNTAHMSSSQPNLVSNNKNKLLSKVTSEDDLSAEYQISKNMNGLDLKSASSTSLTSSSTNVYQNYPINKLASFDTTSQAPSPLNLPSYAQVYQMNQFNQQQEPKDSDQYYLRNQYCMPNHNLIGANNQQQQILYTQQLQQQVKLINRQMS
ncbi:unnamed protein product [Brachionus calyciflorus]|uniref:Serine/threonine-protein kinase PLK4 n=1 Tax=Brachionus calyciflorus TaxID=104777 RepID=A0A813N319_9BILA|nr:unnamed protein product [Brachionus calyciflorus]